MASINESGMSLRSIPREKPYERPSHLNSVYGLAPTYRSKVTKDHLSGIAMIGASRQC